MKMSCVCIRKRHRKMILKYFLYATPFDLVERSQYYGGTFRIQLRIFCNFSYKILFLYFPVARKPNSRLSHLTVEFSTSHAIRHLRPTEQLVTETAIHSIHNKNKIHQCLQ